VAKAIGKTTEQTKAKAAGTAASRKSADIQAIEQSCSKLVNQFAVYNDLGRYEEVADLFTDDGRYARPTDPASFVEGKANLLAAFKARPHDKLVRHLVSNVLIEVTSATTAKGFSYVTQYSGNTSNPAATHGWQANPSQLVGEYVDDYELTPTGWKIRQRSGKLIFTT
jgi:hypothetical protein